MPNSRHCNRVRTVTLALSCKNTERKTVQIFDSTPILVCLICMMLFSPEKCRGKKVNNGVAAAERGRERVESARTSEGGKVIKLSEISEIFIFTSRVVTRCM